MAIAKYSLIAVISLYTIVFATLINDPKLIRTFPVVTINDDHTVEIWGTDSSRREF